MSIFLDDFIHTFEEELGLLYIAFDCQGEMFIEITMIYTNILVWRILHEARVVCKWPRSYPRVAYEVRTPILHMRRFPGTEPIISSLHTYFFKQNIFLSFSEKNVNLECAKVLVS